MVKVTLKKIVAKVYNKKTNAVEDYEAFFESKPKTISALAADDKLLVEYEIKTYHAEVEEKHIKNLDGNIRTNKPNDKQEETA